MDEVSERFSLLRCIVISYVCEFQAVDFREEAARIDLRTKVEAVALVNHVRNASTNLKVNKERAKRAVSSKPAVRGALKEATTAKCPADTVAEAAVVDVAVVTTKVAEAVVATMKAAAEVVVVTTKEVEAVAEAVVVADVENTTIAISAKVHSNKQAAIGNRALSTSRTHTVNILSTTVLFFSSNFDAAGSAAVPNVENLDADASGQERPFDPDNQRRGGRGHYRARTFHSNRQYGGDRHGNYDQQEGGGEGGQDDYRRNRRQHDRQPRTNLS